MLLELARSSTLLRGDQTLSKKIKVVQEDTATGSFSNLSTKGWTKSVAISFKSIVKHEGDTEYQGDK